MSSMSLTTLSVTSEVRHKLLFSPHPIPDLIMLTVLTLPIHDSSHPKPPFGFSKFLLTLHHYSLPQFHYNFLIPSEKPVDRLETKQRIYETVFQFASSQCKERFLDVESWVGNGGELLGLLNTQSVLVFLVCLDIKAGKPLFFKKGTEHEILMETTAVWNLGRATYGTRVSCNASSLIPCFLLSSHSLRASFRTCTRTQVEREEKVSLELSEEILQSMEVGMAFKDYNGRISSLDFHRASSYLVTASDDESIRLYDVTGGTCLKTINSKKYGVDLVCFTSHPTTVIYSSKNGWDESLRLLSLHDNKYLRYFKGHHDRVVSLSLCSRKECFISGSLDRTVLLWDQRAEKCQGLLRVQGRPAISYDDQGLVFAIAFGGYIRMFDARKYEKGPFEIFSVGGDISDANVVKFSNDGRLMLLTTADGHIHVLDSFRGTLVSTFPLIQSMFTLVGDARPSLSKTGEDVDALLQCSELHTEEEEEEQNSKTNLKLGNNSSGVKMEGSGVVEMWGRGDEDEGRERSGSTTLEHQFMTNKSKDKGDVCLIDQGAFMVANTTTVTESGHKFDTMESVSLFLLCANETCGLNSFFDLMGHTQQKEVEDNTNNQLLQLAIGQFALWPCDLSRVASWRSATSDTGPPVIKWAPGSLMFATGSSELSFWIPDLSKLGAYVGRK
ncbi:hypothetical protein VNO77_39191 [Canavalia gladiata]|uniref:WD repeat domain 82 n=2 Tax=Magnoliopsida TaxID=3398 RepID=A0AAN9PY14_CANGL